MCGEQASSLSVSSWVTGSPPRVRGTGDAVAENLGGDRITPACAGNSGVQDTYLFCPQDHPRVCGEQPYISA